jgi:3-oxoacyl-[acyl-carrier protein] reductase
VTLQSGGVPETTREDWREAITQSFVETSMLKRVETLEDVGNVAAFAASDLGSYHDRDEHQHHGRARC